MCLSNYRTGEYTMTVEVFKPALGIKIHKETIFKVKEMVFDITSAKYARENKIVDLIRFYYIIKYGN